MGKAHVAFTWNQADESQRPFGQLQGDKLTYKHMMTCCDGKNVLNTCMILYHHSNYRNVALKCSSLLIVYSKLSLCKEATNNAFVNCVNKEAKSENGKQWPLPLTLSSVLLHLVPCKCSTVLTLIPFTVFFSG